MNVTALLKRIPSQAYIYAVIAAMLISGYNMWAYHMQEVGKRDLLIAQHERANSDLRRQADSLAKVYRTDTLRLTKWRLRTDTMTTTVELWKRDTLRVVEYVTKADSTIRVCAAALQTCEQRVGVAQRGWDGARAEIALLKKQMPSKGQKWLWGAIGVGAGYIAGTALKH